MASAVGRNSCHNVVGNVFCCLGITGQDNGRRDIFQREINIVVGEREVNSG